jgi:hypothetical protein
MQWIEDPRATGRRPVTNDDLRRARRYARHLDRASRHHLVRARCLHRSLVLHRWLRRQGLPSQLRIGVSKSAGAFAAHAWVEMDGLVVNDRALAVYAFTPLARQAADGTPMSPWNDLRSAQWQ